MHLDLPSLVCLSLSPSLNTTHHQRFVLQTRAGRKHDGNHGNETASRQHCLSWVRMDGCMDRWGFLQGRLKGRWAKKMCGRTKIRFSTLISNTLPPLRSMHVIIHTHTHCQTLFSWQICRTWRHDVSQSFGLVRALWVFLYNFQVSAIKVIHCTSTARGIQLDSNRKHAVIPNH